MAASWFKERERREMQAKAWVKERERREQAKGEGSKKRHLIWTAHLIQWLRLLVHTNLKVHTPRRVHTRTLPIYIYCLLYTSPSPRD